ncbi:hypothetical protein G6L53_23870 [Agrobacterium tumefaciens]|nr:hypothetical protein [Agrobacterium tumefaciens]NTE53199.1 hypothetical protein [Agrobacterium tumefaciens]
MIGKDLAKPQYVELKIAGDAVFALMQTQLLPIGVLAPLVAEALALWAIVHGIAILILDDRIEDA